MQCIKNTTMTQRSHTLNFCGGLFTAAEGSTNLLRPPPQLRERLIKSASVSPTDEITRGHTGLLHREDGTVEKWVLIISARLSVTAKSSPVRSPPEPPHRRSVHQWVTKGSQTLHGDLDVQRSSLRLGAVWSAPEPENENCCLTSPLSEER